MRAAMSASLRSVITPILLSRYIGTITLVTPSRSSSETWRISVPRVGRSKRVHSPEVGLYLAMRSVVHILAHIVVLVDCDVVGLIALIRERDDRRLQGLGVDPR